MATRTIEDRPYRTALGSRRAVPAAVLLAACAFLAASCTPVIGWGVVLWNADAVAAAPADAPGDGAERVDSAAAYVKGLSNGEIVPIYVRSNLRKVYIIGVPSEGKKAEVYQWRVERFPSKSKAAAYRAAFAPCADLWGVATRDALQMREKPDNNTARQVYRLRRGEMVKLLEKTAGSEVKTGDRRLPGDWYRAMSGDGTRGYVFSNTLDLLDSSKQSVSQSAASLEQQKRDESIEQILSKTWRPEDFRRMVDDQRYDLDEFSMRYGMFADLTKKQVRIELPNDSKVFNYTEAVRLKAGLYGFQGTNLQIQVRGDGLLTVSYPDENGKSKAIVMALVEEDMEALARAEEARRQGILEGILAKGSVLTSDTYGEITLARSRRFSWKGYDLLSPAVIPGGVGSSGEIAFDRYVDEDLAASFDGVVNFIFDSLPKGDAVRFYYKVAPDGLKLEQMPADAFDPTGLVAVKRASGPITAFFSYGKEE